MEHSLRFSLGRVVWRESEQGIELDFACRNDRQALYKAWIAGSGAPLFLGTLLPEGSMLRLRRKLLRGRLEEKRCWPIEQAGAAAAYYFRGEDCLHWKEVSSLEGQLAGEGLPFSPGEAQSFLLREEPETGRRQLAIPFGPHEPFPLTALLSLCTVQRLRGGLYAVCALDERGMPIPTA